MKPTSVAGEYSLLVVAVSRTIDITLCHTFAIAPNSVSYMNLDVDSD